jgi:ABC-type branched-subunit amino acid transport system permease subunit
VLSIGALLLVPSVGGQYWTFLASQGLVLAISCLGLVVSVGWMRRVSLMQAGLTGAATYLSAQVYAGWTGTSSFHPGHRAFSGAWFALPVLAAVVFGFAGLLMGLIPGRLTGAYLIVLTFAVQLLIEATFLSKEPLTEGLSAPEAPRPRPLGIPLDTDDRYYWFVVAVVLAVVLVLHRLRVSRYGRAMVMAGADPVAAAAAGISPRRCAVTALGIAGACAGASGALQTWLYRGNGGPIRYSGIDSLVYPAVVVAAGCASLLALVAVAIGFAALPELPALLSDNSSTLYLIAGLGMALGARLGPRGMGGLVLDICSPRTWRRWAAAASSPDPDEQGRRPLGDTTAQTG